MAAEEAIFDASEQYKLAVAKVGSAIAGLTFQRGELRDAIPGATSAIALTGESSNLLTTIHEAEVALEQAKRLLKSGDTQLDPIVKAERAVIRANEILGERS